jgi:1,4-alpha-glucan branching enzyme
LLSTIVADRTCTSASSSNLHFAVDRLGFDGFRFDSVSSMLFKDHAIDRSFYGDYGDYFSSNTVSLVSM